MSKKTSRGVVSKNSSTTSAAGSSATQIAHKSSISKSAFAPSRLQLTLFASVIQGFESQNLRVHDTTSGRLRCQHSARPGTAITSLDWGYYGYQEQQQGGKKKRKREQNKAEDVVVAYGTSTSEICMFSPMEGRVVGKLGNAHARGIRDFKFSVDNRQEGWSIGGDDNLVQWDLIKGQPTRTISLPDPAISFLASPTLSHPQLLCASSTPFTIDLDSSDFHMESYDSFKNSIHTLFRSGPVHLHGSETFLAADTGRYINIYDIAQKRLLRTLIAGSEVEAADFYSPGPDRRDAISEQMLAIVTREGKVDLFFKPFVRPESVIGDLKSKSKNLTKKASSQVKLVTSGSKPSTVPIFNASLQEGELMVAVAQGGVDLSFQKIRWQDEGNFEPLWDGVKEVVFKKAASTLNTATTNGVKEPTKSNVDESRAVVVDGGAEGSSQAAAIAISSSEDEAKETSEEEEEEEEEEGGDNDDDDSDASESDDEPVLQEVELAEVSDAEMQDAPENTVIGQDQGIRGAEEGSDAEEDEPTFGELLASRNQGMIPIADGLQRDASTLIADGNKSLAMHSGLSLTTVLTQSLRTNDTNLLESCFHTTDTDIIKSTIQRLDASLAGILLSKLAERLASRPGRYGHLLTWVQWTCVVHGGAIAGRPDVVSKIRTLYKVLTQRANSLDPLLLLKGKLDMLDAQLTLRKEIQAQRQPRDPQDEAGIIYIEGQDNWSSDEDEAVGLRPVVKKGKQARKALDDLVSDFESEGDEDMPMTNGVLHSDSDEEETDSDDEAEVHKLKGEGLLDDEAAEESKDDSHPSDEEDEDSDEEEETDEEDSEMDGFIANDDSIDLASDEGDVDIEDDETPEKPAVKRVKRQ